MPKCHSNFDERLVSQKENIWEFFVYECHHLLPIKSFLEMKADTCFIEKNVQRPSFLQ